MVTDIEKMTPKTKKAEELLQKINLTAQKVGVVMAKEEKEKVGRAFRNLAGATVFLTAMLMSYLVLEKEALISTPQSLVVLAGTPDGKTTALRKHS